MGEVYAAYDPTLDRKLAIKLVRVERGASASGVDARSRLMREAQAIARLSHPNVVIVHDVGTHQDRVFIAMEFIDGGTLTQWLTAQPRTWREILKVFIAAGRGLQHAHEANLVHRDFKPENVMIRLDGEVRVMDFGLVRYVDAVTGTATRPTSELLPAGFPPPAGGDAEPADCGPQQVDVTETGVMMGTPAYMAPEQFSGQIADARSDQFSFCVALYEALYRQRPFPGSTMASLATNVLTGQLNPPPERTEVPIIVWQALRRGLSVAAADRYPSMNELLADLARVPEPPRRHVPSADALATAADLASMLETLLARPVQAKQQAASPSVDQGVVAVYGGDDGVPAALLHFDLPAAGSTAAALTLVPQNVVKEAVRAGKLPLMLMDNLLEVANVLTKLVRGTSAAHLRIQGVYPLPDALPPGIAVALATLPYFVSFDVTVSDYPGGRLTLVGLGTRAAATAHHEERVLARALVVDDSGAMRLVISRALGRLGIAQVMEARNGEEGLKVLHASAAFDALFVDWSMPVMDGITMVKAVRADRKFDGLRIVMVTTEDQPAQMEAALAAGADEYLVKPISDELLRSKLAGIGLKTP